MLRDKLNSLANRLEEALSRERTGYSRFGRVLSEVYFEDRRYAIGLLVEQPEIDPYYLRRGPQLQMSDAVEKFRREHRDVVERGGYLRTCVKRDWTSSYEMAQSIIQRSPIRGLTITTPSEVSARVLNILYLYVNQIEKIPLD